MLSHESDRVSIFRRKTAEEGERQDAVFVKCIKSDEVFSSNYLIIITVVLTLLNQSFHLRVNCFLLNQHKNS